MSGLSQWAWWLLDVMVNGCQGNYPGSYGSRTFKQRIRRGPAHRTRPVSQFKYWLARSGLEQFGRSFPERLIPSGRISGTLPVRIMNVVLYINRCWEHFWTEVIPGWVRNVSWVRKRVRNTLKGFRDPGDFLFFFLASFWSMRKLDYI